MKPRKYEYLAVLQGYYAHGWEDLTAGTRQEVRANLREYRDNAPETSYRIVNRRVPVEVSP